MSSLVSSPSLVTAPATPDQAAGPAIYQVTLTLDPTVLANLKVTYIELLLGANGSPDASAQLTDFAFTGGGITQTWCNRTVTGSIQSGFKMQCRPRSNSPQILGSVAPDTSKISFKLALSTQFSMPDWFTVWLHTQSGATFPTTATGRPGLFASVSWTPAKTFSAAGYAGNGTVNGISDTGFNGAVTG